VAGIRRKSGEPVSAAAGFHYGKVQTDGVFIPSQSDLGMPIFFGVYPIVSKTPEYSIWKKLDEHYSEHIA
jgi:hypothetical protein